MHGTHGEGNEGECGNMNLMASSPMNKDRILLAFASQTALALERFNLMRTSRDM
jgi:hypothetical protein